MSLVTDWVLKGLHEKQNYRENDKKMEEIGQ